MWHARRCDRNGPSTATEEGVLTERNNSGALRTRRPAAPAEARGRAGKTEAAATATPEPGPTLALVLASLDDDKAEDVVTIDLRGRSSIADHMVIASGRSARQVSAMAEKLADRFKTATGRSARSEGRGVGDWVLIDCGDVIVHLFRPEIRAFYQLEKMWMDPADLRARTAVQGAAPLA
jgi:ribosome-associated protein